VRANELGERAVFDLRHDATELEQITFEQKQILFPPLKATLRGTESTLLDVGCGSGRFTDSLANLARCDAVGIDPTAELLRHAPQAAHTRFAQSIAGALPFRDASFDVVWCCLVLGALETADLDVACREIERVLRVGGVLALTDNTSAGEGKQSYRFRSAAAYAAMFPRVGLTVAAEYRDLGETITLLLGRRVSDANPG
jgi:ubiquinone/menaquinone biosynthesis C-methylase UbiE